MEKTTSKATVLYLCCMLSMVNGLCKKIEAWTKSVCPGSGDAPFVFSGPLTVKLNNWPCKTIGRLCEGREVHIRGRLHPGTTRAFFHINQDANVQIIMLGLFFSEFTITSVGLMREISRNVKEEESAPLPFPSHDNGSFYIMFHMADDRVKVYAEGQWYTDFPYHPMIPLRDMKQVCFGSDIMDITDIEVHF